MSERVEWAEQKTPPEALNRAPKSAILQMTGVTKKFGTFAALQDIDISFNAGEVHCLLGENGAGKSTLCNLIFGIHQPTEGRMLLNGEPYVPISPHHALAHQISMVHQHFSLINELSVIDNLLLGNKFGVVDRKREAERLLLLADEFGLSLSPFKLVSEISVGERQQVEIIKCLMHRPRVLILDEPTAVLLPDEVDALLEVCRQVADGGCAVVMVTHKLAEIQKIADRVTVLHGGKISGRSENPVDEINLLVRAMIQRPVSDTADLASFGAGSLKPRERLPETGSAADVLQLDGLSYSDLQGVSRLDNITLTISSAEIVGVAGVEGNGQSELGSIIAGLTKPSSGRWFVRDQELTHALPGKITEAGVGVVPEDRHLVGAIDDLSLSDNLFLNRMKQFTRYGLRNSTMQHKLALSLIEQFDVRTQGPEVSFGSLSGGNQQKAVLARELTTANLRFLLAAHPTRGLDIGAIESVYTLIRSTADSGVGVMLISSELDELIAVADRIVVFYRGRIVGESVAHPDKREEIGALMSGHSSQ